MNRAYHADCLQPNKPSTFLYCSIMKTSAPKKTRIFKFVSESTIRKDYIDLSPWQSIELRTKLAKNLYWIQPSPRGKIHWCAELLMSYLLNGLDCPQHQALVDEFVSTLPQAA
jgi:hypothetical protein